MNLTSPTDTLVCDTTQLARWQSDPAYNYNRELIAPEINLCLLYTSDAADE